MKTMVKMMMIVKKTATEEETGVAAWVSAAVLCAFGDNHHNDHDNHHRNHDNSDDELL